MFYDIHCHLDDKKLINKVDEIVKKCKEEEVIIFNAAVNLKTSLFSLKLAKEYENVYSCIGIHPEFIKEISEEEIEKVFNLIKEKKDELVAISEVGLDYYWIKEKEWRKKQKELFSKFLEIAEEINKPVITHSRYAVKPLLEIASSYNAKVVLHGFSGNEKEVEFAINKGYYFSISPRVKTSKRIAELVNKVPLNLILTETDSPYMGINPKEINYPWNVKIAVEEIARIKNERKEEIEDEIERNVKSLFF